MIMNTDKQLRDQLVQMIAGEHAHVSLDNALKGIPQKATGIRPDRVPYSVWQLAEHIRITQWDIVKFSSDPEHISPPWPVGYWPEKEAPEDPQAWKQCLASIRKDREMMIEMILDPETDIMKPFPYGDGQNLLREALLIIDHTSYHTGEIIVVRRLLGIWK